MIDGFIIIFIIRSKLEFYCVVGNVISMYFFSLLHSIEKMIYNGREKHIQRD